MRFFSAKERPEPIFWGSIWLAAGEDLGRHLRARWRGTNVFPPPLQCSARCRVLMHSRNLKGPECTQVNICNAEHKSSQSERGALPLSFPFPHPLPAPSWSFVASVAGSQGRGQLSSSIFSARSMFMRCPTRVTPSSAKSSLVKAGRWEPSISCSWKPALCSPRFMLSSQSPTSYLFQRWSGFWWKGLRAKSGEPSPGEWEGDGERERERVLELLITKRTSLGSCGRLRLDDLRMVCGGVVGEFGRPKPENRPKGSQRLGEPDPGLGVRRVTGWRLPGRMVNVVP